MKKTVIFQMTSRDFAYFNSRSHDWTIKSGKFDILVWSSSRDLPLKQTLTIDSANAAKSSSTVIRYSKNSKNHQKAKPFTNN